MTLRLTLLILLTGLLMPQPASTRQTFGMDNGRAWIAMDSGEKALYMAGYVDGVHHAIGHLIREQDQNKNQNLLLPNATVRDAVDFLNWVFHDPRKQSPAHWRWGTNLHYEGKWGF